MSASDAIIRGDLLVYRGGLLFRHTDLLLSLQERHHGAQFTADFLDGLVSFLLAHGQELVPAGAVLAHPLPGELARLDLAQDLAHFGAGLLIDDARTAGVVAVFRRIGHRK